MTGSGVFAALLDKPAVAPTDKPTVAPADKPAVAPEGLVPLEYN
jgi:hypothetical protein